MALVTWSLFFPLLNNQHWLNNEVLDRSLMATLEHFGPKILDIILEKDTTFLVVNQSREPETASGLVFYPLVCQGIFAHLQAVNMVVTHYSYRFVTFQLTAGYTESLLLLFHRRLLQSHQCVGGVKIN